MLETVSQRFQGSCMMIMQQSETEVSFLGSGFLVHPEGYILTAARILPEGGSLSAVAPIVGEGFLPVTRDEVAPIPLQIVSRDLARDVAHQILEHGLVARGWLGIEVQPFVPALAEPLGLPAMAHGVLIA